MEERLFEVMMSLPTYEGLCKAAKKDFSVMAGEELPNALNVLIAYTRAVVADNMTPIAVLVDTVSLTNADGGAVQLLINKVQRPPASIRKIEVGVGVVDSRATRESVFSRSDIVKEIRFTVVLPNPAS
ncbi:MAG TPA: hypothetical protein VK502_04390 [Candidatus Saccharimonadales bacterium]|nr:hypothetical protein [Candidatus Saccharimonadales bacterium]